MDIRWDELLSSYVNHFPLPPPHYASPLLRAVESGESKICKFDLPTERQKKTPVTGLNHSWAYMLQAVKGKEIPPM